jgi:UDP-glucuronate 4-epimerase
MRRDFTYIDDVVAGVLAALDRPPSGETPHRIYNLGNNRPVELEHLVRTLEEAIGRRAIVHYDRLQPGDVVETYADIEASRRDLGFEPRTPIEEGVRRFVAWHRAYHGWGDHTA